MEEGTGFIVSARKYRPDTFDTVVGQRSTTATLKNAIRTKHLAQAYLFCGPRGIGKTTCARIFAKTINCTNLSDTIEVCNTCESCESFNQNRSYCIHELDAASNNSVEDIRLLIEKVRIPPQIGNYSVYIIDEVHMLSQSAFNAFLKTLEEPPKHAIFIMATTEKHKILPTILSRCQIFDFNRIKIPEIIAYLESIAKKEKIKYEADALNIIAQKADGAMRDALSVFDQISSFSDNNITYQKVIENLNILDYEYYFRLTDNFLKGDVPETLLIFDEILTRGFDNHNFINGLSRHFRDLLMCKAEKTQQLLEVGESIKKQYSEQSDRCSDEFLFSCLDISNACDIALKSSKNQRLHLEISLIKLCNQSKKKNEVEADEILVLSDTSVDYSKETKKDIPEETKKDIPEETIKDTPKKIPVKKEIISLDKGSKSILNESSAKSDIPSIKQALDLLDSSGGSESGASNNNTDDLESGTEVDPESEVGIQSISAEELKKWWYSHIENLKSESPRMYNVLRNQNLLLSDDGIVLKLSFRNSALVSEFKSNYKADLLSFIKEKSGNEYFEIQEEVLAEESSESAKYYTDLDKLKYMITKNPSLKKLKNDFNLDIE